MVVKAPVERRHRPTLVLEAGEKADGTIHRVGAIHAVLAHSDEVAGSDGLEGCAKGTGVALGILNGAKRLTGHLGAVANRLGERVVAGDRGRLGRGRGSDGHGCLSVSRRNWRVG